MKNFSKKWMVLGVLGAIIGGIPAAQAADGEGALSKPQIHAASRVMICARSLVQEFGPEGSAVERMAGETLEQARTHIQDLAFLKNLGESCRVSLKTLRHSRGNGQNEGTESIAKTPERPPTSFSYPVQYLLEDFHQPYVRCKMAGPEVTAALGVGLTAGVEAGLCHSSDGRRTLAVGANIGVVLGIALTAGVALQDPTWVGSEIGSVDLDSGLGWVPIAGIRWGSSNSVEVGLGFYAFGTVSGTVKLIPLGSDRKFLVSRLTATDLL